MSSTRPSALACSAAAQESASNSERPRPPRPGHSRGGPAASRPRSAARARRGRATRCARSRFRGRGCAPPRRSRAATASAPTESAEESAGTKTRALIASALGAGDDRVETIAVEPADRLAVEQRGGRERAIAEAIDRLDVKPAAAVRPVNHRRRAGAEMGDQILAAHRLTGFGAAQLQTRPSTGARRKSW